MAGSTESREKAVPKYFRTTPEKPEEPNFGGSQAAMAIGAVVAFVGLLLMLSGDFGGVCLGLLAIGGGGFLLFTGFTAYTTKKSSYSKAMEEYNEAYEKAEPKPTDQQIDQWLNADIARLKDESLIKLDLVHLEPDQFARDPKKPITVIGPAAKAAVKMGDDHRLRFSKYDMVFAYLTEYHLAAFNCTLDMTDGVVTRESTQEYHYSDVVSVSTRTESSETFTLYVNGEAKNIPLYQEFALSVASGEQIRVVTAFPKLADYIDKGELPPTGADEAITAIRSRLREKKGGTHTQDTSQNV